MMLTEQVYAQAAVLAGEVDARQQALLKVLCGAAVSSLASRLREGLTPEDCRGDFITAASLHALAALGSAAAEGLVEEFKAGDLTVRQGTAAMDAAARCLQMQAETLMGPYLKDRFAFLGV